MTTVSEQRPDGAQSDPEKVQSDKVQPDVHPITLWSSVEKVLAAIIIVLIQISLIAAEYSVKVGWLIGWFHLWRDIDYLCVPVFFLSLTTIATIVTTIILYRWCVGSRMLIALQASFCASALISLGILIWFIAPLLAIPIPLVIGACIVIVWLGRQRFGSDVVNERVPRAKDNNELLRVPKSDSATFLQCWLGDRDSATARRWKEIGREVYSRKALVLACAKMLQEQGLINNKKVPHSYKLAATDVFVEKAQRQLSSRASHMYWFGSITGLIGISILLAAAIYLINTDLLVTLRQYITPEHHDPPATVVTLIIFKSSAISAFLFAAEYFLVSLARAFFQEGASLLHRRHALRFGRLYIYLKESDVKFDEMEKAFGWNKEFETAFKDIRPDKVSRTLPGEVIKAVVELVKTVMGKQDAGDADNIESASGKHQDKEKPQA